MTREPAVSAQYRAYRTDINRLLTEIKTDVARHAPDDAQLITLLHLGDIMRITELLGEVAIQIHRLCGDQDGSA